VTLDVLQGRIDVVGFEGAAHATFFLSGTEHEMLHDELAATGEKIRERSGPSGPSKTYSFSTLTQGNSRRCRSTSSRWRVSCFSLISSSLRAASHSVGDTTFGRSLLLVLMTRFLLCFEFQEFLWAGDSNESSNDERGEPAR
jgi:hypothetical protein